MIYVALLRGINVGGKNKVDMKELKETFEGIALEEVSTYINSGNVIFTDRKYDPIELQSIIQEAIVKDFQMEISVMIRSLEDFEVMMQIVPDSWTNDKNRKCDVLFLGEEIDNETILEKLTIKPGIDTVRYVPGAVLWSTERNNVTKSGLMKIIGTKIYKKMTVRNVNTTRKIFEIMKRNSETL
jgi:uncharacterized protein (DUF1697 family)